jgi:limonene-1,2-epoxide hydrolase
VHDNDEVADTVAIVATDIAGNEAERLIAVSVKENLVKYWVCGIYDNTQSIFTYI